MPRHFLASLAVPDSSAAIAKTKACTAALSQQDLAKPSQREALVAQVEVPDDYVERNRILGLYPLATLPFSIGVTRCQNETAAMFRRAAAGDAEDGTVVRYEPGAKPADASQIRAIFVHTPQDRLGIPQFSTEDHERLFQAFAPIFEISTSGEYDRFGPMAWGSGPTPEVDVTRPTVFRRLAFTRYGKWVLAQLVYTIWFPERPRESSLDLLGGKLDGLIFRVTLDREGRPLVYDTIHPCGCYHMFFPTARVRVKPSPQPGIEWAFVPAILPKVGSGSAWCCILPAGRTTSWVCASTVAAAAVSMIVPRRTNCARCRRLMAQPAAPLVRTELSPEPSGASACCSGRPVLPTQAQCANGAGTPQRFSAAAISMTRI